jgi:hypothetical protein
MSTSLHAVSPATLRRQPVGWLLALAALGAFGAGLGIDPTRAWSGWLVSAFAVLTLGLGGAVLTALIHVTGGRWANRILELPHRLTVLLPVGAGLALLVGAGALRLYPWADAARVAHDPILNDRSTWMAPLFVGARLLAFGALWTWAARGLVRRSSAAANAPSQATRAAAVRASALFLALFGPTFSVACFDLLLSLEPHWPSTMYALLHFAGLLEAAVAVVVLMLLARRRAGDADAGPETLHDLGKLLFAFAFFWGYLWFCQWMLIWYTNMPEETAPYALRHAGAWQPLAVANVLLGFALPFVLLLSRHAKRSATVLGRVALLVLLGRWLDLTLAVQPTVHGPRLVFGLLELALAAGTAALVAGVLGRARVLPGRGRRSTM